MFYDAAGAAAAGVPGDKFDVMSDHEKKITKAQADLFVNEGVSSASNEGLEAQPVAANAAAAT